MSLLDDAVHPSTPRHHVPELPRHSQMLTHSCTYTMHTEPGMSCSLLQVFSRFHALGAFRTLLDFLAKLLPAAKAWHLAALGPACSLAPPCPISPLHNKSKQRSPAGQPALPSQKGPPPMLRRYDYVMIHSRHASNPASSQLPMSLHAVCRTLYITVIHHTVAVHHRSSPNMPSSATSSNSSCAGASCNALSR